MYFQEVKYFFLLIKELEIALSSKDLNERLLIREWCSLGEEEDYVENSHNTISFSVLRWWVLLSSLLIQGAKELNTGCSGLKVTSNAERFHKRLCPIFHEMQQ